MNKLLPLVAFSILFLVPVGAQEVFAATFTISSPNGGDCINFVTASWDGNTNTCTAVVLKINSPDELVINSDVTLTVSGLFQFFGGTLTNDGTIIMTSTIQFQESQLQLNDDSSGTNDGTIILNGGDESNSGNFFISDTSTFSNRGTITTNGGAGGNGGLIAVSSSSVPALTNEACGIINLNGGIGVGSGALLASLGNTLNHGTINQNGGPGQFSGEIFGSVADDPLPCNPIGGEIIPIDTTALLLAGAHANALWLIPVIVSAIGIGIVIARKF